MSTKSVVPFLIAFMGVITTTSQSTAQENTQQIIRIDQVPQNQPLAADIQNPTQAVNREMLDLSRALRRLDQSYYYRGYRSPRAWTAGSAFMDWHAQGIEKPQNARVVPPPPIEISHCSRPCCNPCESCRLRLTPCDQCIHSGIIDNVPESIQPVPESLPEPSKNCRECAGDRRIEPLCDVCYAKYLSNRILKQQRQR